MSGAVVALLITLTVALIAVIGALLAVILKGGLAKGPAPEPTKPVAETPVLRTGVVTKHVIEPPDPEHLREILRDAVERGAVAYAMETATTSVPLAGEDLKGRIVGREGRNMRAFEQVTGVDLLIDETPDAVVLSSFDPYRREVARLTLEMLIKEGKIQPSRIEDVFVIASKQVDQNMLEEARSAAKAAGVADLKPEILKALARLRFRTSYAQNVLEHSVETARIASVVAKEIGIDGKAATRAALLHDIGKALPPEWKGPHAIAGMEFLKAQGEREPVLNAVGAHHREIEPNCLEAELVILADGLSASRPGARSEAVESLLQRQARLEEIALAEPGVQRAYAVQAGRELRVFVDPGHLTDAQAEEAADRIALAIEAERPEGNLAKLKITLVREFRTDRQIG